MTLLDPAARSEPFWYAVVSESGPVVNRTFRRADVADEYAQECRAFGRTDAEVVPYGLAAHTLLACR